MRPKIVIRTIIVILVLALFLLWLNPFYRCLPQNALRRITLWRTPLGSSSQQVLEYAKRNWPHEDIGLDDNPVRINRYTSDEILVGSKSLGPIDAGSYFTTIPGLPMVTHVYLEWAFDDHDKLIEVVVHKEVDAP